MTDFLTRLASRTLGVPAVRALVALVPDSDRVSADDGVAIIETAPDEPDVSASPGVHRTRQVHVEAVRADSSETPVPTHELERPAIASVAEAPGGRKTSQERERDTRAAPYPEVADVPHRATAGPSMTGRDDADGSPDAAYGDPARVARLEPGVPARLIARASDGEGTRAAAERTRPASAVSRPPAPHAASGARRGEAAPTSVPRTRVPLEEKTDRLAHAPAQGQDTHADTPTVRIRIGRIEVRAVPESPRPAPAARRPRPELSLDDYLKQRSERKR